MDNTWNIKTRYILCKYLLMALVMDTFFEKIAL